MLETIHEYACESLEQSGEAEEVRERHTEYFLAEEVEPELWDQRTRRGSSASRPSTTT